MGSIGTYAVFLPLAAQADFLNKSWNKFQCFIGTPVFHICYHGSGWIFKKQFDKLYVGLNGKHEITMWYCFTVANCKAQKFTSL
jgi:hypothetical protein